MPSTSNRTTSHGYNGKSTNSKHANAGNTGKIRSAVINFAYGDSHVARYLGFVEDKFNLQREYSIYIAVAFIVMYLSFGWFNDFISELIALVYPAMRSLNAIESKSVQQDDTEWLMYWTVYACLRVVDYLRLLVFSWLPFYYLIKTAILIWLMVPGENGGSYLLYNRLVKPHFATSAKAAAAAFDPITDTGRKIFDNVAYNIRSSSHTSNHGS